MLNYLAQVKRVILKSLRLIITEGISNLTQL